MWPDRQTRPPAAFKGAVNTLIEPPSSSAPCANSFRTRFRGSSPHPARSRALGEALVVYYCIDDYAAMPDVDAGRIARLDENLTRDADQVFVASARLIESKTKINPTARHSPHGVDVDLFRRASDQATPVAERARALPRPIIGFFGLIEAWIDLDLIHYLAVSRPNWTFLLVGRLAVPARGLEQLPNVVFTGPQPYEELPKWARAFDAAIIPYHLNQQVLNANPLKLREYLATGKPVVSVPAPEVERFAQWVRIANGREEFLEQLEQALASDSPQAQANRMQAVSGMSWDARVEEVLTVVEMRLRERRSKNGNE
jgi:glycosyltransferase involved in cell wall biosynthesis